MLVQKQRLHKNNKKILVATYFDCRGVGFRELGAPFGWLEPVIICFIRKSTIAFITVSTNIVLLLFPQMSHNVCRNLIWNIYFVITTDNLMPLNLERNLRSIKLGYCYTNYLNTFPLQIPEFDRLWYFFFFFKTFFFVSVNSSERHSSKTMINGFLPRNQ